MNPTTIQHKSKPPYLLGLLCLIPLVWAFLGLGLLLYGLLKYKGKWLSIIGASGIVWTIIVYSTLFYAGTHASVFKKAFESISQMQLNSLVKNIEFYKLAHEQYPDSLQQLLTDDKLVPIYDAAQGMNTKENAYYNYQKTGDNYLLFSSGQDGIPNTKDDLFPFAGIITSIVFTIQGSQPCSSDGCLIRIQLIIAAIIFLISAPIFSVTLRREILRYQEKKHNQSQ